VGETLQLLHEFNLGRKYGKTYTFDDVKYDLEEFKEMVLEDVDFFDKLKNKIVNAIKGVEEQPEAEKKTEASIEVINYDKAKSIEVVEPEQLTPDLFDI
jgi:hypothetical protein